MATISITISRTGSSVTRSQRFPEENVADMLAYAKNAFGGDTDKEAIEKLADRIIFELKNQMVSFKKEKRAEEARNREDDDIPFTPVTAKGSKND